MGGCAHTSLNLDTPLRVINYCKIASYSATCVSYFKYIEHNCFTKFLTLSKTSVNAGLLKNY